ncbi:MAG: hypothetical protein H8E12_06210 [Rhodobacteraceae bacterium]|nr:hypothetical protein [Paracoccaceae bacterium]
MSKLNDAKKLAAKAGKAALKAAKSENGKLVGAAIVGAGLGAGLHAKKDAIKAGTAKIGTAAKKGVTKVGTTVKDMGTTVVDSTKSAGKKIKSVFTKEDSPEKKKGFFSSGE